MRVVDLRVARRLAPLRAVAFRAAAFRVPVFRAPALRVAARLRAALRLDFFRALEDDARALDARLAARLLLDFRAGRLLDFFLVAIR